MRPGDARIGEGGEGGGGGASVREMHTREVEEEAEVV